jgi:hypothetical protein
MEWDYCGHVLVTSSSSQVVDTDNFDLNGGCAKKAMKANFKVNHRC